MTRSPWVTFPVTNKRPRPGDGKSRILGAFRNQYFGISSRDALLSSIDNRLSPSNLHQANLNTHKNETHWHMPALCTLPKRRLGGEMINWLIELTIMFTLFNILLSYEVCVVKWLHGAPMPEIEQSFEKSAHTKTEVHDFWAFIMLTGDI